MDWILQFTVKFMTRKVMGKEPSMVFCRTLGICKESSHSPFKARKPGDEDKWWYYGDYYGISSHFVSASKIPRRNIVEITSGVLKCSANPDRVAAGRDQALQGCCRS